MRANDQTQTKLDFNRVIAVNMKVMEKSDHAFSWIQQLLPSVPENMQTHFRVAGELLMATINATAHVAKENIKAIKGIQKRENYLQKLDELLNDYRKRYHEVMTQLG